MISPRGRIVLLARLAATCAAFYSLPFLGNEPRSLPFSPVGGPKTQGPPKPPPQLKDPQDRSLQKIHKREMHLYRFHLETGWFLLFVVEQEGVDLAVDVYAESGKHLFQVDGLNGKRGPEPVPLLAETPSSFNVQVSTEDTEGRYRVRIDRRRPATEEDRAWAAGARAYWRGRHLAKEEAPAEKIEKSFQEALRQWEKAGYLAGQGDALYKLGDLYSRSPRKESKEQALTAFSRSLVLHGKTGNRRHEINAHNAIGKILEDRDLAAAEKHYRTALALAEEIRDDAAKAACLSNLGSVLKKKGDYAEGLAAFRSAQGLWKNLRDTEGLIRINNKIGRLYMDLGSYDEAREHHQRAWKMLETVDWPQEKAVTSTHFGDLYLFSGNPRLAMVWYSRALRIRERDPKDEATLLNNLGQAHYRNKKHHKAAASYRKAISLFQQQGRPRDQAVVLVNLGWIYGTQRQFSHSLAAYGKALEMAPNDPWVKVGAHFGAAWTEHRRGNLIAAQQRTETAIEVIEAMRGDIDRPELKISFMERMQDVYDFLVSILMERHGRERQRGFDVQALVASERARARSLQEGLSGLIQPPQLSVPSIQRLLGPDTVLLEYFLDDVRSYVFVVTAELFTAVPLPGKETIEPLVRRLHLNLKQSHKREHKLPALTEARKLSRTLLSPVLDRIGERRILVVAPAVLQYVPFWALPDPRFPTFSREDERWPRPVIVSNEVVAVPSVAVLAALREREVARKPPSGDLALLADPVSSSLDERLPAGTAKVKEEQDVKLLRLQHAEDEAQAILPLFPKEKTLVAMGFDATRDLVLKGRLGSFRIVHFAAHGATDSNDPANSAIVLSRFDRQGRRMEGRLRAADIEDLDLSAELVVLSACGTGLGQEFRGEGLVGLTQAFFSAGAPRVVVTLWDINDESTAELMKSFYSRLQSEGPASALRHAQINMWKSHGWSAPSYWGGFVLQGDWRRSP
ncbi:MAG TPA: CHAT domain-containing tetratricopeptide repeat protein [Thermoanaerobaculia bacterium]|nr:CHAT domain-containing tetratricopeptide repeat protein [Thermoanaerobaculia bacterium]